MTSPASSSDEADRTPEPRVDAGVEALANRLLAAQRRGDHEQVARLLGQLDLRLDMAFVRGLAPRPPSDAGPLSPWPPT